jgi:hypothetical protein
MLGVAAHLKLIFGVAHLEHIQRPPTTSYSAALLLPGRGFLRLSGTALLLLLAMSALELPAALLAALSRRFAGGALPALSAPGAGLCLAALPLRSGLLPWPLP